MSTTTLLNTCPACGAEESLDALLMRMIDDDQVRRLIAEVVTRSLPVGGLVVRYLRLHKPAKQKLRMSRVGQLLAELVPDVQRGAITRKGREWAAPLDAWRHALQAVFDAAEKGSLELPLEGNAYLYEVLMRQADKAEGAAEREAHEAARTRTVTGPREGVMARVEADLAGGEWVSESTPVAPPAPAPQPGMSPTVRAMRAEIERKAMRSRLAAEAVGPGHQPTAQPISTALEGAAHDH